MSVQTVHRFPLNLESGLWLSLAHILRFAFSMFSSMLRVFSIAGPIRSSAVIFGEEAFHDKDDTAGCPDEKVSIVN